MPKPSLSKKQSKIIIPKNYLHKKIVKLVDSECKKILFSSIMEKRISVWWHFVYPDAINNYGGACATMSFIMKLVLAQEGIHTKLIVAEYRDYCHVWLVDSSGLIIDPTINQFRGYSNVELYVGKPISGIHFKPNEKKAPIKEESYQNIYDSWGNKQTLEYEEIEFVRDATIKSVKNKLATVYYI